MLAHLPAAPHDRPPCPRGEALPDPQFEAFRLAVASRFRVERELGRGGMATVFLAEDLKNHRPVALKVLRREIASVIGGDRFRREIEIAARLQHPHILPLYDSDEAGGILYYVMPYVEGGTLKDRLIKGPEPSVAESLALARQVAQGLAYAHAQGLVHRDIKPANIFLSSDHAFVGDFGIVRIMGEAVTRSGQLTESDMVVGTPIYMAPEQLRGSADVDGRADQYSLACVLYEMLTGNPPSSAARGADTLQHSLRRARPELSRATTQAVTRALAQDRDARFATVAAFAEALESAMVIRIENLWPRFLRRVPPAVRWLAVGTAGLVIAWAAWFAPWPDAAGCTALSQSDTTTYAVFPFEYEDDTPPVGEEPLLAEALSRWGGVRVTDQFQLREAVERRSAGPMRLRDARDIACRVGVRRFVLGNVGAVPGSDSIRVSARLYDLGPEDLPLAGAGFHMASSLAGADALFGTLADSLLFRGSPPPEGLARAGTRVLAARQAFDSGQRALSAWDLPAADSAFRRAVMMDPAYAAGNLWLALVRGWQRREPALWLPAAQQAAGRAGDLRTSDSLMAQAVLAMGTGEIERACPIWRTLTRDEPRRFAAWYGLSQCLRGDSIVVRDRSSPSEWRFRSSYHEAQQAYLAAIRLLPTILASPENAVGALSNGFLYVTPTRHRKGQALPPDSGTFAAAPGWAGDSLVFLPWQRAPNVELWAPPAVNPAEAIRRQRLLLDTLALIWVTEAHASVDAHLAQVEAMALAVDPAAVDSARSARRYARDPASRVRVIDAEVRTLLQFGLPDRLDHLHRARALADSVLGDPELTAHADPAVVAGLAALTGRAGRAAAAARSSAARPDWDLPKPLLQAAPGLLMYAAMGGPKDSIQTLWRLTRDAIQQGLPEARRFERAMEDVGRPATMVFPAETLPSVFELRNKGDWLLTLQAAFADSGRAAIRRWRDSAAPTLVDNPSTFDTALPIAALLLAAGDTLLATRYLDHNLASIRFRSYESFGNPVELATMVRAMILRARLADRVGDAATARRWAGAVVTLWSGADDTFMPEIRRLRTMAG
ncbi:MAG: serine/threonine protein kinase [Gemmatimonadota bacterium]|nr:serine/threonine protein kinase [Gemmatimonadota bacterium]